MPTRVEIPDQGTVEFPDSMTPDDIKGVIQNKFYVQNAPSLEAQVVQPRMGLADILFDPDTAQNLRGAVQDVVYSLPGMVSQLPKMAYQGLKFAAGGAQERAQVGTEALTEAVSQGQQMAADVQSPLGSRESFRGIANLGLMAAPVVGEVLGEAALLGKKPPIQGEALPQIPETLISDAVQPIEGIENAQQIESATRPNVDVQLPGGESAREVTGGEVPTTISGEGVQAGGQGETLQAPQEITPTAETPTTVAEIIPEGQVYTGARPVAPTINSEGTINTESVSSKAGVSKVEQQRQFIERQRRDAQLTYAQRRLQEAENGTIKLNERQQEAFRKEIDRLQPARDLSESGVSAEHKGPTLALKLDDGSVIYANDIRLHSQLLDRSGVEPQRVVDSGLYNPISREFVSKTPESVDVFPSKSETAKDTGAPPVTEAPIAPLPKESEIPAEVPQSITSIKNEQVDTERSARGLPSVVQPARKAFGESWEQATKKIDEDPGYPDRLVEELKAKPRALNDVEDATLLHRQVDLQNQFQKSTDALFKARESGDGVAAMEHDARVNAISDQLLELYDVGKKAGTETGRGLAARQLLAAEDFSLANMVTQKRAANPNIDLETATKSAREASSKISAAKTAYDAYETSPKAEAYRKRLKSLTEQYRTKTKQGDFETRKPSKILLDKEGEQLKADLERAKKDWLTALQKDRATNRTPSQKFWDRFVGVERAMKLSSDVVLAKLSAAAVVREAGLTPLEEVAGAGIGKILPGLSKRAPREGGFSPAAEIKAKAEMFTSGMKDAWQNLKMKQSDLDTLYSGRKPGPPTEFYDYLGYLHGALKAPIKRAEFARSLTKRMRWAVENGQDLNNVNTMRALSEEAYVDANRSIFMQDNVVANTFTGALRMAENSKKSPNLGPAVARIGRFLVPIVKIPTNIVGEVATGVHGVATGGSRAAVAYLKGIDSLPPVQADSIMRQLKKGAIGNALILTGYYSANHIGGFYHDQDKRSPEDVQPGRYRVGNVDLPASAGHSTGAMLLNIGATVNRVQNERVHKAESDTKGLGQGVLAAAGGLAHEVPFVPAVTGITDALSSPHGFEKYVNGMIQSTTVPALSSHIAKILDTPGSLPSNLLQEPVKRKPTTPLEAVKMGIPGLRQTVPEKSKSKSKQVVR
jgi:hypothetical protein